MTTRRNDVSVAVTYEPNVDAVSKADFSKLETPRLAHLRTELEWILTTTHDHDLRRNLLAKVNAEIQNRLARKAAETTAAASFVKTAKVRIKGA